MKSFADIQEMNGLYSLKMFARNMGLWVSMFALGWLFRKLPIGFSYRAAELLSLPAYLIAMRRRRTLKEELRRLFGDKFTEFEIRTIIKRAFEIYLKRQVENIAFDRMTEKHLDRIVTVEGWDNFSHAERKKRGVIILLAHFGSFLLPLPFLAYKGYRVYQIAGKPLIDGHGVVMRKIFEARKRQTDKMPFRFALSDKYLGPVVRALKRGGVVVIAFDGRTGTEMIPMRLLNRTAQFSLGPFKLARRTGSVIVPTFVVRDENNQHKIIFETPIEIERETDPSAAITLSMLNLVKLLEGYVSRYPCHFAMTLFGLKNEAELDFNPPLFVD